MKYSIKSIKYSLKSLLTCLLIMGLGFSVSLSARPGGGSATAAGLAPTTLDLLNAVQGSSMLSGNDSGVRVTFSWSIPANLQVTSGTLSNIVSFTVGTNALTIQTRGRGSFSAEIRLSSTIDGTYVLANTRADIPLNPADVTVNVSGGSIGIIDDDYIGGRNATQVFDTSFAVEFSYSCLTGGCHETDQKLVDEYTASNMTHTMVKCNACHGTHTADTVGLEKPNLTGYYPGIGATGYIVGRDRCKACHNNQHNGGRASTNDCKSCHAPHVFAPPNGVSNW